MLEQYTFIERKYILRFMIIIRIIARAGYYFWNVNG